MEWILIIAAALLVIMLSLVADALLLNWVTRMLKIEGANFRKALITTLISIPALLIAAFIVGTLLSGYVSWLIPETVYEYALDFIYFFLYTGVSATVVRWRYRTTFPKAIVAGLSVALLSTIIFGVLGYLMSYVSFS